MRDVEYKVFSNHRHRYRPQQSDWLAVAFRERYSIRACVQLPLPLALRRQLVQLLPAAASVHDTVSSQRLWYTQKGRSYGQHHQALAQLPDLSNNSVQRRCDPISSEAKRRPLLADRVVLLCRCAGYEQNRRRCKANEVVWWKPNLLP